MGDAFCDDELHEEVPDTLWADPEWRAELAADFQRHWAEQEATDGPR